MNALTPLRAGGSARSFGLALGRFGKPALADLMATEAWKTVTKQAESPFVRQMAERTRATFPAIWDEIGGMAEGLGLPVDEVFAWNCRGDIWAAGSVDGCTTVLIPGESVVLAHNEDGLAALAPHCGLVEATPAGAVPFVSFLYPASIPGHSFAATGAGLAITVNHIQPDGAGAGLPRMVLCRAALEAESAARIALMLKRLPRAGGFHLSVAETGKRDIHSVEFCGEAVSDTAVSAPSAHSNHMIHERLAEHAQKTTPSSAARLDRARTLLEAEPMDILRDTGNTDLPILCKANGDPNHQITLAQVRFAVDGMIDGDVYQPSAPNPAFKISADPATRTAILSPA